MRELNRSKDTFEVLQTQTSVSVEDVLGLFLDLCEDLKNDGYRVEDLAIANEDKMLANLSRSGRILLKIMKNKEETLQSVDMAGRIKRQEEKIQGYNEALEETIKQTAMYTKQIEELKEQLEAEKSQEKMFREEVFEMQADVVDLKKKQQQLNAEEMMLQNEIDRLKKEIENQNPEAICAEKDRLLKEKMKVDEERAKAQCEYQSILQALEESKEEQKAQKERLERAKSRALDENIALKEKIDALTKDIDKDEKERMHLETVLKDAEDRYEKYRGWFENLNIVEKEKRLQMLQKKIKLYETAQKSLFYEMKDIGMIQAMSNQEAHEKREELAFELLDIEKLLGDYEKKYRMICELLSD